MSTGIENLGSQIDKASPEQGDAAAAAAREAWDEQGMKPNPDATRQLNDQLQQSGLIPTLEITGVTGDNTVTVRDATFGGQSDATATIDGNTMEYVRNNTGQGGATETVTIDMATGREVITEQDGSQTIRGVAGAEETIAVSAVDPATGKRTVTMPPGPDGEPGRTYTVDQNGQIDYNVKDGDNLWEIATDVAKIQGNENPTDQQIYDVVNQMSHVGVNGCADSINANETISFGKGTNKDQIDLALPAGEAPAQQPGQPVLHTNDSGQQVWTPDPNNPGRTYTLPGDVASEPFLNKDGNLEYKNVKGDTVTVNKDTGEEVTDINGTRVYRSSPGAEPHKIEKGDAVLEKRGNDWFIQDGPNGAWIPAGGLIRVDKDGNVQYDGTGVESATHYNLDGGKAPEDSWITDENSIVRIDTNAGH